MGKKQLKKHKIITYKKMALQYFKKNEVRNVAPSDPDIYDSLKENTNYVRSLLSEEELNILNTEGFMTIDQVRDLINGNTTKNSIETGSIDPEILAMIDVRINYKIFIAKDNIYSRECLYNNYPFHEFNVKPEDIFIQQELGVFQLSNGSLEYIAKDIDDEAIMTEDLVKMATKKNYTQKRVPDRIVKTKIYIGKEQWDDFEVLKRFFRGIKNITTAQITSASADAEKAPIGNALIQFSNYQKREEEFRRREEEFRRREEEFRKREEEYQRREKEYQEYRNKENTSSK
jgi:hypothetical protein